MFIALLVLGSVALIPVALFGSMFIDAGMSAGGAVLFGLIVTIVLAWAGVKK